MKSINFILPATNNKPIGGYKIVYQYANELSARGYKVTISFLYRVSPKLKYYGVQKLRRLKRILLNERTPTRKITWYKLSKKINLKFDVISPHDVVDADFVVATAAPTANFVKILNKNKGKKFYFIQNYETWWFSERFELENTYKLGLTNIVISHGLSDIVESVSGVKPEYLPNFYDENEFFVSHPLSNRPMSISLLNHRQSSKRTIFGLEVLAEVKKILPDITVQLFGAYKPVRILPNYVDFTYNANSEQLRENIYGETQIYLMPSSLEGWGLTGTEAMACGAALVASNISGIDEYANKNNSVLVDPFDKQGFVNSIVHLLKHEDERLKLVNTALNDVKKYTLEASTNTLEAILINHI